MVRCLWNFAFESSFQPIHVGRPRPPQAKVRPQPPAAAAPAPAPVAPAAPVTPLTPATPATPLTPAAPTAVEVGAVEQVLWRLHLIFVSGIVCKSGVFGCYCNRKMNKEIPESSKSSQHVPATNPRSLNGHRKGKQPALAGRRGVSGGLR